MSETTPRPSRLVLHLKGAIAGLILGLALNFAPALAFLSISHLRNDTTTNRMRRLAELWAVGFAALLVFLQLLRLLGHIHDYYRPPAVLLTDEPKPAGVIEPEPEKPEVDLSASNVTPEAMKPLVEAIFLYQGRAVPGEPLMTGYHIYRTRPLLVAFVSVLVLTWAFLRGTPSSMDGFTAFRFVGRGFVLAFGTIIFLVTLRLMALIFKVRWRIYISRRGGPAAGVA
uniref:Uncharacterized protein n=1 Tax=Mycena chlorophos TaxID=658473 RepID=A0ABQ0LLV0_MYCCL|nr:predicted protein [Mycena chlorophos]